MQYNENEMSESQKQGLKIAREAEEHAAALKQRQTQQEQEERAERSRQPNVRKGATFHTDNNQSRN